MYTIMPATVSDLNTIYQLFEGAIAFVKERGYIGWQQYDKQQLQNDVNNHLLYKITADKIIAGIFSICYTDPIIWREREQGDAIYLHRIVANRQVEGVKVFDIILQWTLTHARGLKLQYVRMDTWARNAKLIRYYEDYGFRFVENYTTPDTEELPVQHRHLHVALLEYSLTPSTMQQEYSLLIHAVKAMRVRFAKATNGSENNFGTFKIGSETRTPNEIINHMCDLLQKTLSMISEGHFNVPPPPPLDFAGEHARLLKGFDVLETVMPSESIDMEQCKKLLQGPLLDIVTHIGQLAMLNGLYGNRIPGESFYDLEIS